MSDPNSNLARLEDALNSDKPGDSAFALAVELRDAGMPLADLLALFDTSLALHEDDTDPHRYDGVLAVMDFIVGWCSPGRKLYPPPTDTK